MQQQSQSYVGVVEDGAMPRERGAAAMLRSLGADVRTIGLRDDPAELMEHDDEARGVRPRAVVFEAVERPDLAIVALRALRRLPSFDDVGALLAMDRRHGAGVQPWAGFEDFVLHPSAPEELYARVRWLELRRAERASGLTHRIGALLLDTAAHEASVDGRPVRLTAKELALLEYLCARRGRPMSREALLLGVWGAGYGGTPRTVDIHVRRLRAKLGAALPLQTLRGRGYRLDAGEPVVTTDGDQAMRSSAASRASGRRTRAAQAL